MENGKLARMLATFSKDEFKEFGKFLNSPYFNRSERGLERFYEVLKPLYPGFSISKESLYSKLYPGKSFNDKTVKNILTDTYRLAMDFLTMQNFRTKKELESNIKAEALLLKNLSNEYIKESGRSAEILESEKMGSEDYFINFRKYHQLKMTYAKSFYKDKSETEHILLSVEYLLILLLKDLSNILVNKQLARYLNTEAQESYLLELFLKNFDFEAFMNGLKNTGSEFFALVAFRYYLYKDLCEKDNYEYFYKLKAIVYKYIDTFSRETQFEATWAIINSCAVSSRRSNPEMRRESLKMLILQLEKGLHIAPGNNYYSTPAFNQLLAETLYFKEFDIAEKVIGEHFHELEPGIREDMKLWGYASLYFEKKDYEKSLSFASKINFREPNFKVQAKFLLFKIFYEMDLMEQAISILNTSLHTLKLENLSSEIRMRYESAFKNAIKLARLKDKFSQEEAELFRRKIETQTFIGKNWILKKIAEFDFVNKP